MRLVTVAHGTRNAAGNAVAAEITAAASARLGMSGVASYLELASPLFTEVISAGEPSVVVPLLLSTGHHVHHDLKGLRALGPHPHLADAQASRLLDAGARRGQPVVMVASGSRDPRTSTDLERAAEHLAEVWGARVRLATLSGAGPSVEEVIRPGDAVSPYLLAEGHFAHRCRTASARATVVADVLGAHAAVVDLVVARALESLQVHVSVPLATTVRAMVDTKGRRPSTMPPSGGQACVDGGEPISRPNVCRGVGAHESRHRPG